MGDSAGATAERPGQPEQSRLGSQWEALPAARPSAWAAAGGVNSARPGGKAWNWPVGRPGASLIAVRELRCARMQSAEGWPAPTVGGGPPAVALQPRSSLLGANRSHAQRC